MTNIEKIRNMSAEELADGKSRLNRLGHFITVIES
jgi:hypothetical protein